MDAQVLASAILQGLPAGQRRSITDVAPRLARLSVRVRDDVPPALASRLGHEVPGDGPCELLVGGAALDPMAALSILRPGARWVRPDRAEDAAALTAAGFTVLAHHRDSPVLDARAPA